MRLFKTGASNQRSERCVTEVPGFAFKEAAPNIIRFTGNNGKARKIPENVCRLQGQWGLPVKGKALYLHFLTGNCDNHFVKVYLTPAQTQAVINTAAGKNRKQKGA